MIERRGEIRISFWRHCFSKNQDTEIKGNQLIYWSAWSNPLKHMNAPVCNATKWFSDIPRNPDNPWNVGWTFSLRKELNIWEKCRETSADATYQGRTSASMHSCPLNQYLPIAAFTIDLSKWLSKWMNAGPGEKRINNPWLSPHLLISTEACMNKSRRK